MANIATMDSAKFKKAVVGLLKDPAASLAFRGFVAAKKGNKADVFFGFYLDENMKTAYKQDSKAGYDDLTELKGSIACSAKFPAKRLLVSLKKPAAVNAGMARELRLLAKGVCKDCQLKISIFFVAEGDGEPDLATDETDDAALTTPTDGSTATATQTTTTQTTATSTGTGTSTTSTSTSTSNSTSTTSSTTASTATPTPTATTTATATAAPAAPNKPAAPARPTSTNPEAIFLARLQNLMPEIKQAGNNQNIDKLARDAITTSKTDPKKALTMLDDIVAKLGQLGPGDPVLHIGGVLRKEWDAVTLDKLDGDAQLRGLRDTVLKEMSAGSLKAAAKAMRKLQETYAEVKRVRDELRRKKFAKAMFKAGYMGKFDETQFLKDISKVLDISAADAATMRNDVVKQLQDESAEVVPDEIKNQLKFHAGWKRAQCMPNPLIPKETRPKLTAAEAMAICDYSGDLYPNINNPLREGKPLSGKALAAYDEMQKAFDKAKPFPEPIKVNRGMDFTDPAKLDAFIKKCTAVVGTQNVMRLEGFTSTGTAGIPPAFQGNIVLTIIAKKGLDLLPYSQSQHEKELLLNHNTPVLVHQCVQKGKTWEITLEQVLEKPTKKKS